ncbi:MAG TPA: di-heme oxidoredictase family protein [Polyangiaceae bacterium]|nr:di-heme oxidoredictase family protein [Polyangiaceae bacterium]
MSRRAFPWVAFAVVGVGGGCDAQGGTVLPVPGFSTHSSSIALSADQGTVYVVNAESDSVSFVDVRQRTLVREVLLEGASPGRDPATNRFDVAVGPRALALDPYTSRLYVTGQRNGHLYALDAVTGDVVSDVDVCAEPVGVLTSPDGGTVYVACAQDDAVVSLDAPSLVVTATVAVDRRPWGLAWSADGTRLYVTQLLGPGVTVVSAAPLAVADRWALADGPRGDAPTVAHGTVRGIYDVLARPGAGEVWTAHLMLGTDTPQPGLVFDDTVFPALSVFDPGGAALARLTVSTEPGDGAAFGDVVSGPRAMAFSPDGSLAYVADADSEDVLVVDARGRYESSLVRPLPGHQPEGLVASSDGFVYVDEANTLDVAVLVVGTGGVSATVAVSGPPIARTAGDPMPAVLRLGQHVFYSANSDELPTTTDHWVACASCHVEGRSDAVTWQFLQGPRDTPSNAGGTVNTGFLMRTALHDQVQDYASVIDAEQGGHFSRAVPLLEGELDALEQYVDYAIPYPAPPRALDPADVASGRQLFTTLGCPGCHAGAYFTDSGMGNPSLDLAGPVVASVTPGGVLLHDVGTCVTGGAFPDNAVDDDDGDLRGACAFDTPTLRGVSETAPYLHDGRAAQLEDVFRLAPEMVGSTALTLSPTERAALIAYLRSL